MIMHKPNHGRLVWNHSTHIDGLIPVLERLTYEDGIQTITPAVISRARGHSPHLRLKISAPIRGGFKVIARSGKSVQEVFILATLTQEQLAEAIDAVLQS